MAPRLSPLYKDNAVVIGNGVTKKKRGRPAGSKDAVGRSRITKKQLGKGRVKRQKALLSSLRDDFESQLSRERWFLVDLKSNGDSKFNEAMSAFQSGIDDEGEFDRVEVMVPRAEAFPGPDSAHWLEADGKGRLTLEATK